MGTGVSLILAIVVAALIGGAGTVYFRAMLMRRDESAAGLAALSAMSWREFIHLVLDALAARGYQRVFDREAPSGDDDYTLERDDRHWLLSCKHGSAFVLGNAAVTELASAIRMVNAAGGILATQGSIAKAARAPAALQKIELLDGPTLWPELRDRLPREQREAIHAGAASRAAQRTLLSWLLALIIGLVTFLLVHRSEDGVVIAPAPKVPAASVMATPAQKPRPAAPATPDKAVAHLAQRRAASSTATVAAPDDDDTVALQAQRDAAAKTIATLPAVGRATWTSPSNLEIVLTSVDGDAFKSICPVLLRYDALAASRVQLTPPVSSNQSVRFRQCRAY